MRIIVCCCFVAVLVLAGAPVHALEPFALYDDFTATSLDPVKWLGLEFIGRGTEAGRLVSAGALHMTYRAFGNPSSNSGRTSSAFGLALARKTTAITALQARVKVSSASAADCAGNTSATTSSRAGLRGSFFTSGSSLTGGATNDVHALIFLRRVPTDAGTGLRLRAQIFRCASPLCSSVDSLQEKDLGPAVIGQSYVLQIEWDKPNRRFFFQVNGVNPKATISYSLLDFGQPSVALKMLELAHDVENCTTPQS